MVRISQIRKFSNFPETFPGKFRINLPPLGKFMNFAGMESAPVNELKNTHTKDPCRTGATHGKMER